MQDIYNTYQPKGFTNVNSYLMVEKPEEFITFLKQSFYAEELNRTISEEGTIRNCIVKIGNTCFMIAQAYGDFLGMKTTFYLYTNDVDSLHNNAITNGATEFFPPKQMDYGDYQGGVIDSSGNYWWISNRTEEQDY